MLAASAGECMAVLVRNPFELVKQKHNKLINFSY